MISGLGNICTEGHKDHKEIPIFVTFCATLGRVDGQNRFRSDRLKVVNDSVKSPLSSDSKHGAHLDEKYLWDALRPIIPYPTGRFFRGMLSQALRARLRSVLSLRDPASSANSAWGTSRLGWPLTEPISGWQIRTATP
jgi:hypothetical protein